MSRTMDFSDTALPLTGSCSWRLTPRNISGFPFNSSCPPFISTFLKPIQTDVDSRTSSAFFSVKCNRYRFGVSAVHLATSSTCPFKATVPISGGTFLDQVRTGWFSLCFDRDASKLNPSSFSNTATFTLTEKRPVV